MEWYLVKHRENLLTVTQFTLWKEGTDIFNIIYTIFVL
jgi:hypothetical protein